MNAELNNLNCGRENDLIAFLYGESDATEQEFYRHMQNCAGCKAQVAAFADIRESVVIWRNESLGAVTPPLELPAISARVQPEVSAWAALREFFNLSPLWMKGAVVFASLLFCVFAVLAAARLTQTTPEPTMIGTVKSNSGSEQEFKAQVERRVQEELQRLQAAKKETPIATPGSDKQSPRRRVNRNPQFAKVTPQGKAPLSKLERAELAADLRLTAEGGESELVLIGDRINQ